jgi:uncharacterized protein
MTALIGSFSHIRMGNIDPKTAVVFGIPSILGVFATRAWLLVPAIPQILFTIGGFEVTKLVGFLLLFAVIMLAAS